MPSTPGWLAWSSRGRGTRKRSPRCARGSAAGGGGRGGEERALLDSLLTQLRLMVDKVEAEREKAATLVLQAQHLQDEEDSSVSAERSDEDGDEVPGLAQ